MRRESASAGAFAAATEGKAQAVALTPSPFLDISGPKIAELALQSNLPTMGFAVSLPKAGGLIAYGPSILAIYRRAAYYVDRILKGEKPADLPVEQPTKFEMAINLKTARALGLIIPPTLLATADEVIE
jgi:putative ABC transport system substrate-binding protein